MNPKNSDDLFPYAPIPTNPVEPQQQQQNVVVVLQYLNPNPTTRLLRRVLLLSSSLLLLLCLSLYLLFPSDPTVQLTRIHLNRVHVNPSFPPTIDLSFNLTARVRNADLFSVDYNSLAVSVGYRGRELGVVQSAGGRVKARGSSYVDATLELDGLEVAHDAVYLIQDWLRGVIPFDTVTRVHGHVGLFFLRLPVKGKVACEVFVNVSNQTIVHRDCCPEVRTEEIDLCDQISFLNRFVIAMDEETNPLEIVISGNGEDDPGSWFIYKLIKLLHQFP